MLVPALASGKPLRVEVTGGTHNPLAPPFEFLDRVFVPHLRAMGGDVTLTLEKHGFLPKGGGKIVMEIGPSKLKPIEVMTAGEVVARRVTAIVAGLPRHIAEREIACAQERMKIPACEIREFAREGPHNLFMAEVELARRRARARDFTRPQGLSRRGCRRRRARRARGFLEANVPVGEHLADQLLLPLAVAGGGRFRCDELSLHATTNIDTISAFLEIPIKTEKHGGGVDVIVG